MDKSTILIKHQNTYEHEEMIERLVDIQYKVLTAVTVIQLIGEIIFHYALGQAINAVSVIINVITLIVCRLFLQKKVILKYIGWSMTIASLIIISNLYFFHNDYVAISMLYAVVIFLTGFYGRRSLVTAAGIAAILLKGAIDIVLTMDTISLSLGNQLQINDEYPVNMGIYILSIIATAFIVASMISMEDKRKNYIKVSVDPLTGVYNRKSSREFVEDSIRIGKPGILMLLDIDGFNKVNEQMGYTYGDEVLKDIAVTIRSLFREHDLVGRLDGDKFIIFAIDITLDAAKAKAERLICTLSREVVTDSGLKLYMGASIGMAIYQPNSGKNFDTLYREADDALNSAQNAGKEMVRMSRI